VPLNFGAQGGNFAGAQQTVLTVTIVDSLRGQIRLVEQRNGAQNNLLTNQLLIQAFDVDPSGNPLNILAGGYNGPVVLTFRANGVVINNNVTVGGNPLIALNPFTMVNGELLLSDVLVNTALGDFSIEATFTLSDFAGTVTVSLDPLKIGQFVRSNIGRQRGR
jgi:hypothetical protein